MKKYYNTYYKRIGKSNVYRRYDATGKKIIKRITAKKAKQLNANIERIREKTIKTVSNLISIPDYKVINEMPIPKKSVTATIVKIRTDGTSEIISERKGIKGKKFRSLLAEVSKHNSGAWEQGRLYFRYRYD